MISAVIESFSQSTPDSGVILIWGLPIQGRLTSLRTAPRFPRTLAILAIFDSVYLGSVLKLSEFPFQWLNREFHVFISITFS